jgi:hypothetical protein
VVSVVSVVRGGSTVCVCVALAVWGVLKTTGWLNGDQS